MKAISSNLKAKARRSLMGRYNILVSAYLLTILIPNIVSMIFSMGYVEGNTLSLVIQYAASFIISILSSILSIGMLYIVLNVIRKKTLGLGQIFYGFKHHADKFIIISIIFILPTFPGQVCTSELFSSIYAGIDLSSTSSLSENIASALNSNLSFTYLTLLVYGIGLLITLYLMINYIFIFQVLLDQPQLSVPEAFRQCKALTQGNRGLIFYMMLSFLGWILLNLCSVGIAMLWIMPYIEATFSCLYLKLTDHTTYTTVDETA